MIFYSFVQGRISWKQQISSKIGIYIEILVATYKLPFSSTTLMPVNVYMYGTYYSQAIWFTMAHFLPFYISCLQGIYTYT